MKKNSLKLDMITISKKLTAIKFLIYFICSNFSIHFVAELYPNQYYMSVKAQTWTFRQARVTHVGPQFQVIMDKFEGLRLKVYNDRGYKVKRDSRGLFERPRYGHLTIGYGHLLTDEEIQTGFIYVYNKNQTIKINYLKGITRQQAFEILKQDTEWLRNLINSTVIVSLNQNQYDALASYVFNTGYNAFFLKQNNEFDFSKPTLLLKKLNSSNFDEAHEHFSIIKSRGVVLPGLVLRRSYEKELFLTPNMD